MLLKVAADVTGPLQLNLLRFVSWSAIARLLYGLIYRSSSVGAITVRVLPRENNRNGDGVGQLAGRPQTRSDMTKQAPVHSWRLV